MTKNLLKGNILELVVDVDNEKEVLELCRLLKKLGRDTKHKFLITTKVSLRDFHNKVGKAIANSTQFQMTLPELFCPKDDTSLNELIGRVALDTALEQTYFIKSEADLMVYEIRGLKECCQD